MGSHPVFTGDASADQAGLFWGHERLIQHFPEKEQHPHKSSNFRELKTACVVGFE